MVSQTTKPDQGDGSANRVKPRAERVQQEKGLDGVRRLVHQAPGATGGHAQSQRVRILPTKHLKHSILDCFHRPLNHSNFKLHNDKLQPLKDQIKAIDTQKIDFERRIKAVTEKCVSKSNEVNALEDERHKKSDEIAKNKGDYEVI